MKLIRNLSCLSLLAGLLSCNSGPSFPPPAVELEPGYGYTELQAGDKAVIAKGDSVVLHVKGMLAADGSVFQDTREAGKPEAIRAGHKMLVDGLDRLVLEWHSGQKVRAYVPAKKAYGYNARKGIPSNSDLVYEVEVLRTRSNVRPRPRPKPLDTLDIEPEEGMLGLLIYRVEPKPEAQKPVAGQKVSVHYTGYLEDGTVFDNSYKRGKPAVFTLGKGEVIQGWEYAFAELRLGEKARLVIPSELAYGTIGVKGRIPANSNLTFDVEVVRITEGKSD